MTKEVFITVCSDYLDAQAAPHHRMADYAPVLPSHSEPESVFYSVARPEIATSDYVRRLVNYTQCSPSAFVLMLIFLDRLVARQHWLRISAYNLHRLALTALTLACKVLDDTCFSNMHYAKVGGIPSVAEMNRLELQFLFFVKFDCHVTVDDFYAKLRQLDVFMTPKSPRSIFDLATGAAVPLESTANVFGGGTGNGGAAVTAMPATTGEGRARPSSTYEPFPHPVHVARACVSGTQSANGAPLASLAGGAATATGPGCRTTSSTNAFGAVGERVVPTHSSYSTGSERSGGCAFGAVGDRVRGHAHAAQSQAHGHGHGHVHGHGHAYGHGHAHLHAHGGHAQTHSQNAFGAVGEPVRHAFGVVGERVYEGGNGSNGRDARDGHGSVRDVRMSAPAGLGDGDWGGLQMFGRGGGGGGRGNAGVNGSVWKSAGAYSHGRRDGGAESSFSPFGLNGGNRLPAVSGHGRH